MFIKVKKHLCKTTGKVSKYYYLARSYRNEHGEPRQKAVYIGKSKIIGFYLWLKNKIRWNKDE